MGTPGSGKTTTGHRLAASLGVPFVELDAIFHQPNWRELPRDVFRTRVGEVIVGDAWVVDGNYGAVRDLVWQRADTVVWLDPPRWVVLRRVVVRKVRRAITRELRWNGNREPFSNLFRFDPEENVIADSVDGYSEGARRYTAAMRDPGWRHLRFVRLTSQREVDDFLA